MIGFVIFQRIEQSVMGNILNININRRRYVITVFWVYLIIVVNGLPKVFRHFLYLALPFFTRQIFGKSTFNSFSGNGFIIIDTLVTNGSVRNGSHRIFAYVYLIDNHSAFVFPQIKQRKRL